MSDAISSKEQFICKVHGAGDCICRGARYWMDRALRAEATAHEPPDVPRDNYGRAEPPHGYAYRYHALGGDVLRFNSGEPVNGGKPFEAVPYWLGKPPAQPQGVDDLYLMLVRRGYAQHEADEIAKMTARIESGMPAQPPETVPVPDKAEGTDVCRWCYFTPDKCICTSQPPGDDLIHWPALMSERVELLERALVYACFALHKEPRYQLAEGITLIDSNEVRVEVGGRSVMAKVPAQTKCAGDANG
jgi:hypothetical protein